MDIVEQTAGSWQSCRYRGIGFWLPDQTSILFTGHQPPPVGSSPCLSSRADETGLRHRMLVISIERLLYVARKLWRLLSSARNERSLSSIWNIVHYICPLPNQHGDC